MSVRTIKIILTSMLVAAVIFSIFLGRGDARDLDVRVKNSMAISRMSMTERNRVMRNYDDYLVMDSATRKRMTEFHHQLEQDRISSGGALATTLAVYDHWLKTLNPYQRDQLMHEKNPAERLKLVKEFLQRQREETARRAMPSAGPNFDSNFLNVPGIDSATRQSILKDLEQSYLSRFSADQIKELDSLQGLKREVKLLHYVKDFGTGVTPRPLLIAAPPEFKEIANNISKYTQNQRLIDFITTNPSFGGPPPMPPVDRQPNSENEGTSAPPEMRREPPDSSAKLIMLLNHSLRMELDHRRRQAENKIDRKALQQFLVSLSDEDQNELMGLEATNFNTDLRNLYLDSKVLVDLPTRSELTEIFGRPPGGFRGRMRGGDRGDRFGGGRPPRRPDVVDE